jgi:PIN like domain
MGRAVPRLLREHGWLVEAHDDHFAEDTKDPVLLPAVAQRNWVMLTEDRRMRYRAREREAYQESGLRMFALVTGALPTAAKVAVLLSAEAEMRRILSAERGPFLYRVAKDGSLRRLT